MDWRAFSQATADTQHTQRLLDTTETLLSAVRDAETGQRGYLLTGEPRYLEPYNAALAVIPERLRTLVALVGPGSAHTERVRLLQSAVSEKLDELRLLIDIRNREGLDAAIARVRTDRGKIAMDRIREICGQIIREEYSALVERSRLA